MRGVFLKIFYEVRLQTILLSLALCIVMGLLTALLPKVLGDIGYVFDRLPFIKPMITAMLGTDVGNNLSQEMMQAFLWVHPTVLSIVWAHELMYCSRLPAGEIDRGTVDFLLGLPVSRWRLYLAETIGWIATGILIIAVGYVGHWFASRALQPDMLPGKRAVCFVLLNFLALYLAVGGFTFLISASSDRRGRAIGTVFAVLLFSFLLNFLAQYWEPAKQVSFLSVMEYYRPARILQNDAVPLRDLFVLVSLSAVFWITGGVVFQRRSICTV